MTTKFKSKISGNFFLGLILASSAAAPSASAENLINRIGAFFGIKAPTPQTAPTPPSAVVPPPSISQPLHPTATTQPLAPTPQARTSPSAASKTPSSRLEKTLPGTKLQATSQLDRKGLKLILNEKADGVIIEGWNTQSLSAQESETLFQQFGVRVDAKGDPADGHLIAPSNVGRAGILEGDTYMKLGGKIYKGMTLKGYGGNVTHNGTPSIPTRDLQPEGSMALSEAFRDMEASTILLESNVSTYVGVLAVSRPTTYRGSPAANYVRLSRTALRMEDFIRVKGTDLAKLVDYMTDLLTDEMGKKMSVAEFDQWLVSQTADMLARKTHLRFRHASITESNIGIVEMVDLGDPQPYAGLKLPGEVAGDDVADFKTILKRAHDNIATLGGPANNLDFEKTFTESYDTRLSDLRQIDAARLNLNAATEGDLMKIGFTKIEAEMVLKFNADTPDGIIDPSEIKSIQNIARDIESILEKTTTDFMKLADGTQLGRYYVRSVGGAEGVRGLLEETREFMQKRNLTVTRDPKTGAAIASSQDLSDQIEKLALERAKKLGLERVGPANEVTRYSKFISMQILEVIARK